MLDDCYIFVFKLYLYVWLFDQDVEGLVCYFVVVIGGGFVGLVIVFDLG